MAEYVFKENFGMIPKGSTVEVLPEDVGVRVFIPPDKILRLGNQWLRQFELVEIIERTME